VFTRAEAQIYVDGLQGKLSFEWQRCYYSDIPQIRREYEK
jgi:hypothetical protein